VTVTSEVTVTLTPAATLTASPTFTETPIPTLTPDQQTALDAAKVAYGDTGWEIQPSGEVLGAPEGVSYNVDKGVLTRTYIYEGIELTVDLTINTETPMPEGCIANFEGWCLTKEKELARKTYSTASGYGYEGDGNLEHEKYLPLLNLEEIKATLANPDNVDLSVSEYVSGMTKSFYKTQGGVKKFFYGGTSIEDAIIIEEYNKYAWADNIIPIPDGKGGYALIPTTVFLVSELKSNPITRIAYTKKDGTVKVMFGDRGDLQSDNAETKHPTEWSAYYIDNSVKW
jgi:hypothetical protein